MNALVAQGIEHRIPNPGVARSIRAEGTNNINVLPVLHFALVNILEIAENSHLFTAFFFALRTIIVFG